MRFEVVMAQIIFKKLFGIFPNSNFVSFDQESISCIESSLLPFIGFVNYHLYYVDLSPIIIEIGNNQKNVCASNLLL